MIQPQEKTSENKTQVTAANINRGNTAVQLKDNREHSVVQQKLSEKTVNQKTSITPIQRKQNDTGLPNNLKSGIENLSGHSMDDVKVHYNSSQPAQLNAHAYAQGSDIHIASGQEKHLPHEAWHVVQQKQGRVKPTLQMKGKVNINDDKGLENEADVMGAKAIQFSNHNDVIQNSTTANKSPLIETPVVNKVIQNMIGPDGDGKLVIDPTLKVYRAKKNKKGSYDLYNPYTKEFKQHRIAPTAKGYYIYEGELDDSEDTEKSSDSGESSSSDESSSSSLSLSPDESLRSGLSLGSGLSLSSSLSSSSGESSSSDESLGSGLSLSSSLSLSSNDKKGKPKKRRKTVLNQKTEAHARLKRIIKQGIFNAIGEGLNPRYIRSDNNMLIKLVVKKFTANDNKLGLLPDLFKGINVEILREVIREIESEPSDGMQEGADEPKRINNVDDYIEIQREISSKIKAEFESPTGNIELIHDGNYPPLIIHFPLLRTFIIDNQERETLKAKGKKEGKIRADQAKGMTKLLSARLISLYNKDKGSLPRLVEKSSFGFQIATLADLGDNLSIRLSPGINKDTSAVIVKALKVIDTELEELIKDKSKKEFPEKVTIEDPLYKYWEKGKESKSVSAAILRESYNKKKPLLKHLVNTQVETGAKGLSVVGRILERNHDNIMFFAEQDATLKQMAGAIFDKNTKEELTDNISDTGTTTTLSSPNLDLAYDDRMGKKDQAGDDLQRERLAVFKHILRTLKTKKTKIDHLDNDPVSDSENDEDVDDGKSVMSIKTGKVVLPSGMAALSVLLRKDDSASLKAAKKAQEGILKKTQKEILEKAQEKAEKKAQEKRQKEKKKTGKELTEDDLTLIKNKIEELQKQIAVRDKSKAVLKKMVPKDRSVYYEDHDLIKMMRDSVIPEYSAENIIMVDLNPNITQSSKEPHDFDSELTNLTTSNKKVWVVDLTSCTAAEQGQVYTEWKNNKIATLLVTRVSAIKQQEGGQNINPHGLIHWAHKTDEEGGHEVIRGFFNELQKKFPRSSISNEIRRYFKKDLDSFSWKRIFKKDEKDPSLSGSLGDDSDGYSSGDEKGEKKERKRERKERKREWKEDKKEPKEGKREEKKRKGEPKEEIIEPKAGKKELNKRKRGSKEEDTDLKEIDKGVKKGKKESNNIDFWYYDEMDDVAFNPESFPLFKTAYLEDMTTSSSYLTEGEGYTLAKELGISLTVLQGELNLKQYRIIKNSGSGDCLIHTLDTANSIIKGQIPLGTKRYDSRRTQELRELIAERIEDSALQTLILTAVYGNEPGLGPRMRRLIASAKSTQKRFPVKKSKATSSKKPSPSSATGPVILPQLGNGHASTILFANHSGLHWQLAVKRKTKK